jgi:hypothetical protein
MIKHWLPSSILIAVFSMSWPAAIIAAPFGKDKPFVRREQQFVELGEFIKLFMMDSSDSSDGPDWFVRANETGLPIKWITSGVEERLVTPVNQPARNEYFRDARARIKVNGSIMTRYGKKPKLLPWDIELASSEEDRPMWVDMDPDLDCFGSMGSGCNYDLQTALRTSAIHFDKRCEYTISGGETTRVYRISVKGKKDAYLIESTSLGSGGESTMLRLTYPNYLAEITREIVQELEETCHYDGEGGDKLKECLKKRTQKTGPDCPI